SRRDCLADGARRCDSADGWRSGRHRAQTLSPCRAQTMRHLWNPFVAAISAILIVAYGYLAWRLTSGTGGRIALAVPFAMIWLVPVVYWVGERENKGWVDETVHVASYLCMGWV